MLKKLIVVAAVALGAREALACEMVCTKTVLNGSEIVGPSMVEYDVALSCPAFSDRVTWLDDTLVGPLIDPEITDWRLMPWLDSTSALHFPYTVPLDYDTCKTAPGAALQPDGSVILTNTVTGSTLYHKNEDGSPYVFSCSAQVVCRPPTSGGGATRTIGYYKTHAGAVAQCLAGSPINLGFTTVSTVAQANAVLWANPGSFKGVDKARATLARQTLAATCNARLFGTSDGGDIAAAVSALAGQSCTAMSVSNSAMDAFNNSGDEVAFPAGAGPWDNTGKPSPVPAFPASGLACQ
ncbi:MAG TPA: hypothetical protein VEB43_12590 [Anaeromyxobacter sp.]|nr:hypothetical protein [Anaeromyxobacter sp.]